MLSRQPGRSVFSKGEIVTEKSHEADEFSKNRDRDHDLRVYGTALLQLV
jgi:hypothetical protein